MAHDIHIHIWHLYIMFSLRCAAFVSFLFLLIFVLALFIAHNDISLFMLDSSESTKWPTIRIIFLSRYLAGSDAPRCSRLFTISQFDANQKKEWNFVCTRCHWMEQVFNWSTDRVYLLHKLSVSHLNERSRLKQCSRAHGWCVPAQLIVKQLFILSFARDNIIAHTQTHLF